jgi:hypothetical protein
MEIPHPQSVLEISLSPLVDLSVELVDRAELIDSQAKEPSYDMEIGVPVAANKTILRKNMFLLTI